MSETIPTLTSFTSGDIVISVVGGADAIQAGVAKTHIIDGRIPHSLLLEIYTEAGIGTEIGL